MNRMMELLESRTMFNVASVHASLPPNVHHAATHASKAPAANAPLYFQGTAYNSTQDKIAANVIMSITRSGAGYQADIVANDPAGGKADKLRVKLDASGHFSLDRSENGKKFHLEGQVNAEKTTVTGIWSEVRADGTSSGTFSLGRVTTAKTTAPPRVQAVGLHFVGLATDSSGATSGLVMDLVKGADGAYFGVVRHTNHDGTIDALSVKFDANGHLLYTRTDKNGGSVLHIDAQLSGDQKTISGTFAITHQDRPTDTGTIALSLSDEIKIIPSPVNGPHYVGTATNSDGNQSGLLMDLVMAHDGSVFGMIKHTNSDGTIDAIAVKFDANGNFVYNGDDKSNHGVSSLHVEGQLSADKKAITGTYTSSHEGGRVETGTFSLALV